MAKNTLIGMKVVVVRGPFKGFSGRAIAEVKGTLIIRTRIGGVSFALAKPSEVMTRKAHIAAEKEFVRPRSAKKARKSK